MINLILASVSTVQELVPKNIKRYESEPIMFVGDGDLDQRAYATIQEAEAQIATNVFWFNCTEHRSECAGYRLPQFRVGYRQGYFSVYGEETTDARKLANFVTATRQSMFNHFGSENVFVDEMERQEEAVFLIARGPSEEELENLCLYEKNRIRAAYFEAPKVSLTMYRFGLKVDYTGELEMQAVESFVELNRAPIFGKLTINDMTQPKGRLAVILVFDPASDEQKQKAKDLRSLIKKLIVKQAAIAKKSTFYHTTPNFPGLQPFFEITGVSTLSPRLFVFHEADKYAEITLDFLKIEQQLQDVADGTLAFNVLKSPLNTKKQRIVYDDDDF